VLRRAPSKCARAPRVPRPRTAGQRLRSFLAALTSIFKAHAKDSGRGPCSPNTSGPYTTHIIPIARVRRKRQRLHSNGSIESDPANHHPRPSSTFSRRVTPDRDLTSGRIYSPITCGKGCYQQLFRDTHLICHCPGRGLKSLYRTRAGRSFCYSAAWSRRRASDTALRLFSPNRQCRRSVPADINLQ
jgi:hypothetical protein